MEKEGGREAENGPNSRRLRPPSLSSPFPMGMDGMPPECHGHRRRRRRRRRRRHRNALFRSRPSSNRHLTPSRPPIVAEGTAAAHAHGSLSPPSLFRSQSLNAAGGLEEAEIEI